MITNWFEQMSDAAVTVILILGSENGRCLESRNPGTLFRIQQRLQCWVATPSGLLLKTSESLLCLLPGTIWSWYLSAGRSPP